MLTDVAGPETLDQRAIAVRIPPLDGEGPLWLQIRRSMAAAILTGEWPAGTRVPPELLLTIQYATAWMTVNKALQSLASEGLVQRRPKLGTIVTARARASGRPTWSAFRPAAISTISAGGSASPRSMPPGRLAGTLRLRGDGIDRTLSPGEPPYTFSGAAAVIGSPIEGLVRDLNLMVRDGQFDGRLCVTAAGMWRTVAGSTVVLAPKPVKIEAGDARYDLATEDALLLPPHTRRQPVAPARRRSKRAAPTRSAGHRSR